MKAKTISYIYQMLREKRKETEARLRPSVDRFNQLLSELTTLNCDYMLLNSTNDENRQEHEAEEQRLYGQIALVEDDYREWREFCEIWQDFEDSEWAAAAADDGDSDPEG